VYLDFTEGEILDGPANMARDIELLRQAEAGCPGCRVYGWTGPWVTLGRFQSPGRDLVAPDNTNWVIRPTGGKAVLHGHDITVGLAIPLDRLNLQKRSLSEVYRAVIQPIVAGMRACGVQATLAEETRWTSQGERTADCFAFSSPNDIVDALTGLKVCGCALRLTATAVLVQASLPNGKPLVDPERVIKNAALSFREWDARDFPDALKAALEATIQAPICFP
jgi:lipoyl(octanoyl) transferase